MQYRSVVQCCTLKCDKENTKGGTVKVPPFPILSLPTPIYLLNIRIISAIRSS